MGPIEKRKTLRRLGKLIDPVIDLVMGGDEYLVMVETIDLVRS